jgi:hypothetical protein
MVALIGDRIYQENYREIGIGCDAVRVDAEV